MTKQFHLFAIGLALVVLLTYLHFGDTPGPVRARVAPVNVEEASDSSLVEHEKKTSSYQQELQDRLKVLNGMEEAKDRRDLAASQMSGARKLLVSAYRETWSQILRTNWNTFLALRQEAAHDRSGQTHCTLCDGKGFQDYCVLCSENPGKCVSCKATGRTVNGQTCPTCLGNKQCFLCFGSGRMLCPFCNNGVIEFRRALPSGYMPTD